ncbi:hypothetical protein y223_00022 [Bordetella phage PY223]
MKTPELKAALRARFCAPEWALLFEVGDATGASQRRWADAVAMNLYPSRGLEIHGFELKASRSDWLRELKNPAKAESVSRFCNRWWIVAPPGVVNDGELPPTWGMYEAKGGKLRQAVAAPKLEAHDVTRAFVAAMLRRASEADEGLVRAAAQAEVESLRQRDEARIAREIERRTERNTRLQKRVEEIERQCGVKLDDWTPTEEIGRAIRLVMASGALNTYRGVADLHKLAQSIANDCGAALATFTQGNEDGIEATATPQAVRGKAPVRNRAGSDSRHSRTS